MQNLGFLVGLIDSIIVRHTHKQLIKEFGIQQMENQTALDVINRKTMKNRGEINKQILRWSRRRFKQ